MKTVTGELKMKRSKRDNTSANNEGDKEPSNEDSSVLACRSIEEDQVLQVSEAWSFLR